MTFRTLLMAGALALALPAVALAQGMSDTDPTLAAAKAATDAGDLAGAIVLYEQAAAQGVTGGASELARIYLEGGAGVVPDYALALEWATTAAEAGDSRGLLYLGKIWMEALGVEVDPAKAAGYFAQANDAGDRKAARYLGLIATGQGDPAAAAEWYAIAAERGDITSQFYLGQAYERGAGVAQDYGQAMAWYAKSAERGDLIASDGMVGMAGLYENGLGVDIDLDKATALYEQAAALGNTTAQAALIRLGG